ncbi:acetyl-CoA C-acetyltransferase [Trinickia symbiotica]|uniref:Acetyl-CoA C-acyltransferase n=1 Tax=Trinickia symbiotica TaxID=863227 RepID=A0A2N7X5D8_9BURK|nr:beta-ketothiolase BktB [Trinickia symbiotica]PMS36762.1 acetyl-CoA C-acyltransferase [Trinickia symbiotica]PPK46209.1 acetyl-CoA C-acetyltransferase [Trinickia symbiotica]
MQDEVVVTAAVRTAIGDFGGALATVPPTQLGATVVRALLDRTSLQGSEVGHVVFGNVIHTEPRDMYLSRVAALEGGVSADAPALTLNRLCGSGLQAIISAAQAIALGDTEVAIGGGSENMSRAAYVATSARWGSRMGDIRLIDMMVGALTDPFSDCHMGVTAENVAKKWGISRDDQDRLAVESHRRAADAILDGYFREQIVPVTLRTKKGESVFDTDEHVRAGTTIEDLAKLRPAFQKDGTVTAGNASGLNDGAAAVLLMTRRSAEQRGIRPLARLVSYAHAGVDPQYMGIGPVPAARKALRRAGLSVADIDVIEANEAFAAQACAVAKELEFDSAKVNPNGSGISLGHPIGATGAVIAVKAIHELQRCSGRYALVTMCIGGGQGIAAVFERI